MHSTMLQNKASNKLNCTFHFMLGCWIAFPMSMGCRSSDQYYLAVRHFHFPCNSHDLQLLLLRSCMCSSLSHGNQVVALLFSLSSPNLFCSIELKSANSDILHTHTSQGIGYACRNITFTTYCPSALCLHVTKDFFHLPQIKLAFTRKKK